MSLGYAERLSAYPHKGVCGLPELRDTRRALAAKLTTLAGWARDARRIVVLTGAGISTASGIPDFRGPKGIWTLAQQKDAGPSRKKRRKQQGAASAAAASPAVFAAFGSTTTMVHVS